MQVDRAVCPQLAEIVGAAVVLVDEDRVIVDDDERRVTPGPSVIDDSTWIAIRNAGCDLEFLGVDGPDELAEAEVGECAVLFAGRVAGQQDRDVASQVRA